MAVKKKKKGQEGISVGRLDHPLPLDKIPWVPAASITHPSSLCWCHFGLTVREDLLQV